MRLALLEEFVGAASFVGPHVGRGKTGMLVAQRNVCAVPPLEIVTLDTASKAKLQVLGSPASVAVRKPIDLLEHGLVEQTDRAEEVIPVFLEREAVPDEARRHR